MDIDKILGKRTLPVSFTIEYENGKKKKISLDLKPMKIKALRKIAKLQKTDTAEAVLESARLILNTNTTNYKIKDSDIEELSVDQLKEISQAYLNWISEKQKN